MNDTRKHENPCFRCSERWIDTEKGTRCHSSCEKYILWLEKRKKLYEEKVKSRKIDDEWWCFRENSMKKYKKGGQR